MALNPPTDGNRDPFRVPGEHFVLWRCGVEFHLNIDGMGKLKGKGKLIITTLRLVLINEAGVDFKAFDIPYGNLFNEKFCQPIFGSNYWEGSVKPLFNSLPGDTHFKIWFTEGGC